MLDPPAHLACAQSVDSAFIPNVHSTIREDDVELVYECGASCSLEELLD